LKEGKPFGPWRSAWELVKRWWFDGLTLKIQDISGLSHQTIGIEAAKNGSLASKHLGEKIGYYGASNGVQIMFPISH